MNAVEEKRHEAVLDFIKNYSSTYEMDDNGDTGTEYAKVVIVKAFEDHKERGHVEDEPSVIPALAKICVDAELDSEYQDMVKESTVRMLKDMLGQLENGTGNEPYKLIVEEDYDRNIYVFMNDGKIIGLNFHQECGDVIEDYTKPCPYLSRIYENLVYFNSVEKDKDELSDVQRIHKAIDLYNRAYGGTPFVAHTSQRIPESQLEIVREALGVYKTAITTANQYVENDELHSKVFDIKTLLGMFSYEVVANLSKSELDGFCSIHGLDFPEYT